MYPEEKMRSQVIGIILGSMALGVLVGYPFGGILYAFSGKSAPFYIIAILIFIIFGNVRVWSFEWQFFKISCFELNNFLKYYFQILDTTE